MLDDIYLEKEKGEKVRRIMHQKRAAEYLTLTWNLQRYIRVHEMSEITYHFDSISRKLDFSSKSHVEIENKFSV